MIIETVAVDLKVSERDRGFHDQAMKSAQERVVLGFASIPNRRRNHHPNLTDRPDASKGLPQQRSY